MPATVADAIFWVAVACCAVAELFILRSAFAARPAARTDEMLPPVSRTAEIIWAIVPAVVLALVLALTWRAMHPETHTVRLLPPIAAAASGGAS